MSDSKLRKSIIRLAHQHPEFRKDLLPLVQKQANMIHSIYRAALPVTIRVDAMDSVEGYNIYVVAMTLGDAGPLKLGFTFNAEGVTNVEVLRGGANVNPAILEPWKLAFWDAIQPRMERMANFPPDSIGKEVSGPEGIDGSDADKPWSKDHFTQMWFEELNDKQDEGLLSDGKADPPHKFAGLGKFAAGEDVPQKVQDLADTIREGNPAYNDAQAYATAWSVYCKYVEPNSPHCNLPPSEYLINRAASHKGIRKSLIRLAHARQDLRSRLIPFFKSADEMQAIMQKDADPKSHDQNKPETWNNLPPKGKQATETSPSDYTRDADPKSHDQNKPETYNYGGSKTARRR